MSALLHRTCLAALTVALSISVAGAVSPRDRRFVSAKLGIGVEAPPGWTFSTHTGFPSILVLLLHPDGSRISVAASDTPARNARELADLNRKGLEAQKLAVGRVAPGPRNGIEIEARAASRNETVIQLYLVREMKAEKRQAVVLSLVTKTELAATHRQALDVVIAKLSLEPVEPTVAPPPTAGRAPSAGTGGSAGERTADQERR